MIDQALLEFEIKSDSKVTDKAEKTVIDAVKMCAMEAHNGPVRTTLSLAIRSVIENILNEGVVADLMQRAAMRAVSNLTMIKAASNAVL